MIFVGDLCCKASLMYNAFCLIGGQTAMGLRFILGRVSEKLSTVTGVVSGEEVNSRPFVVHPSQISHGQCQAQDLYGFFKNAVPSCTQSI